MVYDNFVQKVKRQDPRNIFEPCNTDLSFIPQRLRAFYKLYNPVDVEVVMADSTSIRLCPVGYLKKLQLEYPIDRTAFIFATKEGDAIYLMPGGIYTRTHVSTVNKHTKIADSFDAFIEMINIEMLKR